ncbi:hypothetical protein FWG95_02705 [Candidatus Saccharibacteria bacterium]|nr:hypothetical protein [Candidatus Saccharibacteria bacterium]
MNFSDHHIPDSQELEQTADNSGGGQRNRSVLELNDLDSEVHADLLERDIKEIPVDPEGSITTITINDDTPPLAQVQRAVHMRSTGMTDIATDSQIAVVGAGNLGDLWISVMKRESPSLKQPTFFLAKFHGGNPLDSRYVNEPGNIIGLLSPHDGGFFPIGRYFQGADLGTGVSREQCGIRLLYDESGELQLSVVDGAAPPNPHKPSTRGTYIYVGKRGVSAETEVYDDDQYDYGIVEDSLEDTGPRHAKPTGRRKTITAELSLFVESLLPPRVH